MHVQLEQDINASADAAWLVLGSQFADIADWATFVKSSRALSAEEVPNSIIPDPDAPVPGRETTTLATLREVIIDYSDTRRALTFAAIGLPRIVRRMRNTQTVHVTGDATSKVTFDIDMEFASPFNFLGTIMARRMTRTFPGVLQDLKAHVESGKAER